MGIAPAPMGRISLEMFPPPTFTGSLVIDSLIAGDHASALSAAHHLALPVVILSLVFAAPLVKQTRAIALDILNGDAIKYARASGLSKRSIRRVTLRNSLVPIVTFIGAELTAMLSAASLLELIFAWGGLGQWGLQAILSGDFAAVQGYALVLAVFATMVFVVVDALVLVLEPRAAR